MRVSKLHFCSNASCPGRGFAPAIPPYHQACRPVSSPDDMPREEYTFRMLAAQLQQAKIWHNFNNDEFAVETLRDMASEVNALVRRLQGFEPRND